MPGRFGMTIYVNGEPQVVHRETLPVAEILTHAGRDACVDSGRPGDYYLERLEAFSDRAAERLYDERWGDQVDPVTVREGDRFLAVHRGRQAIGEEQ